MKYALQSAIWLCVAATIAGFFLPWARVDLRQPEMVQRLMASGEGQAATEKLGEGVNKLFGAIKRTTESVTGALPGDVPKEVTGFDIPRIANQRNAKIAQALLEIFMGKQQHIGAKSYAVYLLPGLALISGMLLTWLRARRPVVLATSLVCLLIAVIGFWKLLTTNTTALLIAVVIGPGLWVSLSAYLGLAVAGLLTWKSA